MTDRDKVVKLATEVMGWYILDPEFNPTGDIPKGATLCSWSGCNLSYWAAPERARRPWNPLESIANAYEMESKIPVALRDEYCRALWNSFAGIKTPWRSKFEGYWYFTHATARQRCDAAISALEAQHG